MDEIEEQFASFEFPEENLREFRREILNAQAMRPGLDGDSLHKHLRLNGFSSTVDELMSPSVHSDFIYRSSGAVSARDLWDHVTSMMIARSSKLDRLDLDLTDEQNWERHRAEMRWDEPEDFTGDELSPTLH
jgi:hypothetical protein